MNWFRLKHLPLTAESPATALDVAEAIVARAYDARRAAFEDALAEMDRPLLTTEQVLDLYLARVVGSERAA